jgi:predicted nucleic acid-binding protein
MRIFIDTSAFLAVLNKNDQYHPKAFDCWEELLKSDNSLFTSNYVLIATIALLQNRFGIEAVRLFANNIQPSKLTPNTCSFPIDIPAFL